MCCSHSSTNDVVVERRGGCLYSPVVIIVVDIITIIIIIIIIIVAACFLQWETRVDVVAVSGLTPGLNPGLAMSRVGSVKKAMKDWVRRGTCSPAIWP